VNKVPKKSPSACISFALRSVNLRQARYQKGP
jgi:hypothetical protein